MAKSVKAYVKGCDTCLRTKASNSKPYGLLEPLDIPEARWKRIGVDFITKLPTTRRGNDMIITFIDHLTKRAHWVAASETINAEDFARIFLNEVVRLHGLPDAIILDRDRRFVSAY